MHDIVKNGLVNHPVYNQLIGQVGTTPHEFFEDFVKIEKEALDEHKSSFKQVMK